MRLGFLIAAMTLWAGAADAQTLTRRHDAQLAPLVQAPYQRGADNQRRKEFHGHPVGRRRQAEGRPDDIEQRGQGQADREHHAQPDAAGLELRRVEIKQIVHRSPRTVRENPGESLTDLP